MPDYSRFLKRMRDAEAKRGPEEKRRTEKFRRVMDLMRPAARIDASNNTRRSARPKTPRLSRASRRSTLH